MTPTWSKNGVDLYLGDCREILPTFMNPIETQRLLEKYGWCSAGCDYWDHVDYPMEQFMTEQAVAIAREMCRKDLQRAG